MKSEDKLVEYVVWPKNPQAQKVPEEKNHNLSFQAALRAWKSAKACAGTGNKGRAGPSS